MDLNDFVVHIGGASRLLARPAQAARPGAPEGVLTRNNTNFPASATAKLRELYDRYVAVQSDSSDPEHGWAGVLKYYQYLVRAVMSDPEYGIGAEGNARGLLIFHLMGMGKTRLAVAVAMALWDVRPVVVMLPRSLRANFRETVSGVVGLLNAGASPMEIARRAAEAAAKFTFVSMDAYNSADQMARVGTGATRVKRGDLTGATGGLDGKLLIVDEAHNFFRAIINSSAENANARRIYDMVMAARNLRLVFLTGTPAAKDPFELVPCFNMLAGATLLPTQYEIFYKLYVDRVARKVRNPERLANRLVGLVSHVAPGRPSEPAGARSLAAGVAKKARDDGWFPEELPTIVERTEMGVHQYRQYLLAREKEGAEGKTGEGAGGRGAGVMTTPPLSLPGSEKKAMRSYFVKSRTLSIFCPPREWANASVDAMPDDAFTAAAAPKLALIAERADKAPGPVLAYSQFVEAGGLKPLGRFLQQLGYAPFISALGFGAASLPREKKRAPPAEAADAEAADAEAEVADAEAAEAANSKAADGIKGGAKPKGHYAIISGEVSGEARAAITEAFNSPANAHGAVIKAILVSKTGAEGLDLKWLRETHQIEPYWDKARDHQVTARAVRIGSHDGLPPDERVVQPYLYIATANRRVWEQMIERDREPKSIDEIFYERANERYEMNSAFRELLATLCFECELFGYGACRVCVPTNAPLFHDDPGLDIRLPDPCEVRRETDVEATPLEFGGVTYYYKADASTPLGYVFYVYREDLGGYAPVDPSDPIVAELLRVLAAGILDVV